MYGYMYLGIFFIIKWKFLIIIHWFDWKNFLKYLHQIQSFKLIKDSLIKSQKPKAMEIQCRFLGYTSVDISNFIAWFDCVFP